MYNHRFVLQSYRDVERIDYDMLEDDMEPGLVDDNIVFFQSDRVTDSLLFVKLFFAEFQAGRQNFCASA